MATRPARYTLQLFVCAIFLSAALLFSIQPIVAKLALPRLGGSPAVWTTAMLFFQAVLLAGYLYAHVLATRLPMRLQAFVQGAVLILGGLFLPIALPDNWQFDSGESITFQVLILFALMVAAPFFALSANAPLLQRWYAASGRADADDPYFLYGASNVGSIIALLGYPLLMEPFIGARAVSLVWAGCYVLFGLALVGCAFAVPADNASRPGAHRGKVPLLRQLRWVALAAVPSSMMLSTTQIIATDIGSFPLLWVIPLALYLLSFVVAFSRTLSVPEAPLMVVFLVGVIFLIVALPAGRLSGFTWPAFGLMIAAFVATALVFHIRLYRDRPTADSLTVFYLAMSLGGVLGGVFNALVAPLVFDDLLEAPIILALVGLVLTGPFRPVRDLTIAAVLGLAVVGVDRFLLKHLLPDDQIWQAAAIVTMIALLFSRTRPLQFSALAACLLIAGYLAPKENTVQRSRSFFGVYTVHESEERPEEKQQRVLSHSTTVHGLQYVSELGSRPEVLGYYHRNGPMGRAVLAQSSQSRIGIVGLGVGALSCHAREGQAWTFFEIDAEVDRIARDPELFSYMDECGRQMPTVLGDGRIELERAVDQRFDLLILDAFSSDAIPVHLLTVEAIQLYLDRLTSGGVVMFHVSNRYFDLPPVLGRAAATLGVEALIQFHYGTEEQPLEPGDQSSTVVLMSASKESVARYAAEANWHPIENDRQRPWTDDFASLIRTIRSNQ